MSRTARIVAPGYPHHITQRGNRQMPVFFREEDYELYISLMSEWCAKCDVQIWAYCLMPNHVHLIAVLGKTDSLARAVGEAHRRYTTEINRREDWAGHLWQGRFSSFVMDESYTLQAARYIELNPVKAGIVIEPGDYSWSSARAHISGENDSLVKVAPLLDIIPDWQPFLSEREEDHIEEKLRVGSIAGWPLGGEGFVEKLEKKLGRPMKARPRGRPKTSKGAD